MAYTADEVLKAESGPITIPQGLKKDDKQLLSQRTVALPPPTAMHVPLGTQYLGSSPTKHRKGKLIKALEPRYSTGSRTLESHRAHQNNTLSRTSSSTPSYRDPQHRARIMDPYTYDIFHQDKNEVSSANDHHTTHLLPPISTIGQPPLTPSTPGALSFEVGFLRNDVNAVQSSTGLNRDELLRQSAAIEELSVQNEKLFQYLQEVGERLGAVEHENVELRRYVYGSGGESTVSYTASRASSILKPLETSTRTQTPEDTKLSLSEEPDVTIKASPSTRKAKGSPSKDGKVKAIEYPRFSFSKRKIHNLTNMLPPIYTQVPVVPLTDTEIVVYFFNSLSRPHVSIRLYIRGWGPAKIVEVLNAHREIDPPYLRNTCSVKCTTAQRRGITNYGIKWDEEMREAFRLAGNDDKKATRLLKIKEDECEEPVDIDVLDLLNGLKGHPEEDAGIFTDCVRWCEERQQSWPVSEIHKLALALEAGVEPELPAAYDEDVNME